MPVYQVNMWVCSKCGKVHSEANLERTWSDPLISPPKGWHAQDSDVDTCEKEFCPECAKSLLTNGDSNDQAK